MPLSKRAGPVRSQVRRSGAAVAVRATYQPPPGSTVNGAPTTSRPGVSGVPAIFTNIESMIQVSACACARARLVPGCMPWPLQQTFPLQLPHNRHTPAALPHLPSSPHHPARQQTFNSTQPGQRNDWREVEGCYVLFPPSGRTPSAVAHFLGEAFVGAAPQVWAQGAGWLPGSRRVAGGAHTGRRAVWNKRGCVSACLRGYADGWVELKAHATRVEVGLSAGQLYTGPDLPCSLPSYLPTAACSCCRLPALTLS